MSLVTEKPSVHGVGLSLKRELIPQIQTAFGHADIANINFIEIAPENWINTGGKAATQLDWFAERYRLPATAYLYH